MIQYHTPTQKAHSFGLKNKSSITGKARSYISTLSQHVLNGSKTVPDEIREQRQAICNGCDKRDPVKNACKVCGCKLEKTFLGDKLAWAVSSCPLGKWQAYHENPPETGGISGVEKSKADFGNSIRFDHENLHPEISGLRFNSSIIESGDGYLYSFRNGWSGSRLFVCRLTNKFEPIPSEWAKLELPQKGIVGHEDGRLFRLNGKLHMAYVAYGGRRTTVRFCRINEDTLRVEDAFTPIIEPRRPREKNHSYFDYQGVAHAVYESSPMHRILRIEGNKTEWAYETPFTGQYSGGPIRGGASPVLVDGFFWHFFHGVTTEGGRRRYNTGVTVFRAEPPFDIVQYTPHPIDIADTERKHDCYCDCLFVGGCVYKDGVFITASGLHDRWGEIRFYGKDFVESNLVSASK